MLTMLWWKALFTGTVLQNERALAEVCMAGVEIVGVADPEGLFHHKIVRVLDEDGELMPGGSITPQPPSFVP